MNDVLLISTQALIDAYEKASLKELEIGKEEIVDTHYISNLHKLDMIATGLQLGNGLKVLKTTEQAFTNEKEIVEQKPTSYSDCNLDLNKTNDEVNFGEYKYNIESLDPVERKINDAFKVVNNKTNEYLNELVKDYKEIDDYLKDCLNCKPNFDPAFEEVNFEFAFNFANFLNEWKKLLSEIKASLDPTNAFENLCELFEIVSKQVLCLSSWPLILMTIPIIIGDIQAKMMEVRLSIWAGLGFIVNPIMSIATNIVEFLKNLFLPVLDCLDSGLTTIKNIITSIDTLTTNVIRQAYSIEDTYKAFTEKPVVLPSNEKPNPDKLTIDIFGKRPSVEFSLPPITGRRSFSLPEQGLNVRSSERNRSRVENETVRRAYKQVDMIHQYILRGKLVINETFDNILYTFKALSEYLSQPLKANFQLLGELKVLFNLFSLIQLVIGLINNGMSSCEDIKNNKSKFSSMLPEYFKDIQVFAESPTDEELVLIDNFNGENKRSVKVHSCGDIFANVNANEKNLDTIYDIISMNNK